LTNTLPNSAINHTANPNQREYNIILIVPSRRDNGNIVAIISVYVGEQVVNMGPSDAHRRICHQILWDSLGHDIFLILSSDLHCSRSSGNIVMKPKPMSMIQDIYFRILGSILMKIVDILSRKVNIMIDIINDSMIINTLL